MIKRLYDWACRDSRMIGERRSLSSLERRALSRAQQEMETRLRTVLLELDVMAHRRPQAAEEV